MAAIELNQYQCCARAQMPVDLVGECEQKTKLNEWLKDWWTSHIVGESDENVVRAQSHLTGLLHLISNLRATDPAWNHYWNQTSSSMKRMSSRAKTHSDHCTVEGKKEKRKEIINKKMVAELIQFETCFELMVLVRQCKTKWR